MNPRAKTVKVLDDFRLEIEFDNGELGVFSVKPYLKYPVYRPLENPDLFKKARIVFGAVAWNDELDISPDNLYLESKMTLHSGV